jgi:hypothetical protein
MLLKLFNFYFMLLILLFACGFVWVWNLVSDIKRGI